MHTVIDLSRLAGVTRRTLHYYDEIGLLPPTEVRANGYRYYDDGALLRLQQILIYRELGLPLEQIKAVLDLLVRWHRHMHYFYEPSIEVLGGLGDMYNDHPDFNATFTAIHPDLPAFLKEAIAHYVDVLETRWLEKELGNL